MLSALEVRVEWVGFELSESWMILYWELDDSWLRVELELELNGKAGWELIELEMRVEWELDVSWMRVIDETWERVGRELDGTLVRIGWQLIESWTGIGVEWECWMRIDWVGDESRVRVECELNESGEESWERVGWHFSENSVGDSWFGAEWELDESWVRELDESLVRVGWEYGDESGTNSQLSSNWQVHEN